VICILSDYGTESVYVAELIGAIKKINPDAEVLSLTNNIGRQNIFEGAFILKNIAKEYPQGSIFICIVDPGVGTQRAPIIIETFKHVFIGPDNGLLYLVAKEEGINDVYIIDTNLLHERKISKTFHGRDIFAIAAAILSLGYKPSLIGHKIERIEKIEIPAALIKNSSIEGKIIYIDGFGNLITNISIDDIRLADFEREKELEVIFKDRELTFTLPFKEVYAEVDEGKPLLLIDSFDLLEIAVNKGNAREYFSAHIMEDIIIRKKQWK
jgi:S-adenosylmethionine hydrolase